VVRSAAIFTALDISMFGQSQIILLDNRDFGHVKLVNGFYAVCAMARSKPSKPLH